MTFEGFGVIWDKDAGRPLVNFKNIQSYETSDEREIGILLAARGVVVSPDPTQKDKMPADTPKLTKKDLVVKAKELGITGADRMSKSELKDKLSGI